MASPSSRGFEIGVMPRLPDIDPRTFNTGGGLVAGLNTGLSTFGALRNISEAAALRPTRRRLADIELAMQENALAMQPALNRRKLFEIGLPVERVVGSGVAEVPRYPEVETVTENGAVIRERPAGFDVTETEEVDVYDPGTGSVRRITRNKRPISTIEQQQAASDMTEYRNDISTIRSMEAQTRAEAARLKSENDRIKAEAAMLKAQALQTNPQVGFVDVKKADGRTYRQYFPKGQPQQIIHEIDRGEMGSDIFNFGGTVVQGGGSGKAGFQDKVSALLGDESPAGVSFQTPDQVKAAFSSGSLTKAQAEKILQDNFGFSP